jgi:hypothetical protein
MAVFVSGSDETAGKHQRDTFLYAGFLAPEEDWSRFFAPAWEERVLDGPPLIPYLHMTEIRSPQWRAEHGLSRLDAEDRIDEAFNLIDTMATLHPVGVSLDAGHLHDRFAGAGVKVVARTGGAKPFDPDYLCFLAYAYMALLHVETDHPEAERVDFIVERKGHVTKYIQEFHSNLPMALEALGKPELSKLVGELIPGEKERIPLQAADVLCWHTARHQRPNTMDAADLRRYAKIARRKGSRWHMTEKDIVDMETALSPWGG